MILVWPGSYDLHLMIQLHLYVLSEKCNKFYGSSSYNRFICNKFKSSLSDKSYILFLPFLFLAYPSIIYIWVLPWFRTHSIIFLHSLYLWLHLHFDWKIAYHLYSSHKFIFYWTPTPLTVTNAEDYRRKIWMTPALRSVWCKEGDGYEQINHNATKRKDPGM
jgi:hypothetical protein